jgi:hypothetical protein
VNDIQFLADAIGNAAPTAPSVGGVCVISDVTPGVAMVGALPVGRSVKVTGVGGSPVPVPVFAWSQVFDDRITTLGGRLVGRRVFVLLADRQPFIVDLAVSAPAVNTKTGG